MYALLIMAFGNFFLELSTAIGKKAMVKKSETIYGYAFLSLFWVTIFLIGFVLLGADFHFSKASLPVFIPRLITEIIMAQIGALAIKRADLSTFSFMRLITIPLLLMIDIVMGYKIQPIQMLGMMIIFGLLFYLLSNNSLNRKGSGLVVAIGLLAAINLTLFKYDITHYNSVAAEQILIALGVLVYLTAAAWLHAREKTWAELYKLRSEVQSLASGLGSSVGAFAYKYAAASVIVTFSRTTELLFAILFGNIAFHERKLGHKIAAFIVVILALILIALN